MITVTGCMEYLATKHPVQDTGHVGMERLLNNFVVEDYYTMNNPIAVIGQ